MIEHGDRDVWLSLSDAELLRRCDMDAYRAGGPGGQKRNKTSSAVRLRHRPSGLIVIAEESRSQHENKARALKRLRMAIALRVRRPMGPAVQMPAVWRDHVNNANRVEISRRNEDYPWVIAVAIDAVQACQGRVADAAARLGIGTAQLSRLLISDPHVLGVANEIRRASGLRPLSI